MEILEKDGSESDGMLTDDHMYEFNKILIQSNTGLKLEDTVSGRLDLIKKTGSKRKRIQVLFSGPRDSGHWICIYFIDSKIFIYDSLRLGLNSEHKAFINRMFPDNEELVIVQEKIQLQEKLYNCGVFAIANIVSILFGVCPCSIKYKESEMRGHLKKILKEKKITIFPNNKLDKYENFKLDKTLTHSKKLHYRTIKMTEYNVLYQKWLHENWNRVNLQSRKKVNVDNNNKVTFFFKNKQTFLLICSDQNKKMFLKIRMGQR